jgi:shikimate dehydrogenase
MTILDQYAVFGQPINHSKSPRIHQLFAEQTQQALTYVAQEVSAIDFSQALKQFIAQGGKGLNCTVPLKELAWQAAEHLTERAQRAKAVNTLVIQANGHLLGDNTDGIGLVKDLTLNHAIELKNKRILILGAGGATRGILAPIISCQPSQISIANRNLSKAETLVAEFTDLSLLNGCEYADLAGQSYDVILNATSASLSNELPPLPQGLLAAAGSCYDLAYGNQPTAFVKWGYQQEALNSLDGLGMLVEQAAEAFYLWRGIRPQTAAIITLLEQERKNRSV